MPLLLVGAGGIGTEALKCLLLLGFKQIDVMDLDTIDVSNLNRHNCRFSCFSTFPKAEVTGYLKDVTTLTISDVLKYSVIVNALDNLAARKHINSLSVLSSTPLVESGTTGFAGQSTAHVPFVSECFECIPKVPQKSLPVCTIRGVPLKAEHSIAWAKSVVESLLGGDDGHVMGDMKLSLGLDQEIVAKKLFVDDVSSTKALSKDKIEIEPLDNFKFEEYLNCKEENFEKS
ncbi:hypothetical protein GEMRC1_010938 [Eukaryota sp. GEM-RC1]